MAKKWTKELTKKRIAAHIKCGGTKCPYCGGYDIQSVSVFDCCADDSEIQCLECGAEWKNVYFLVVTKNDYSLVLTGVENECPPDPD